MEGSRKWRIMMYPWLAFGHMNPYLHLANELAARGHTITFLSPEKALPQLRPLNLHPTLITFHPLTLPHVDRLPPGAQTCSDVPISSQHLLATAMDGTADQVEAALRALKPDFLFFDFSHWASALASNLGIKSVYYCVICAPAVAHLPPDGSRRAEALPPGYPSSTVVFRPHEAWTWEHKVRAEFGGGLTLFQRITAGINGCDAFAIRTCREIEGPFCDFIGRQFRKPVLLTGPVLSKAPPPETMGDRWENWLRGFKPGSVIYCSFGSQNFMERQQFQEIVLGLELTGLPFLVIALRPPTGAATVEEALPAGFSERVGGRGLVHGGWGPPPPSFLNHPSVGCFVSHCGFGSMWESLTGHAQLVLVPEHRDQILNTRLLSEVLEVAVEVEVERKGPDENWRFSKESLCRAIKTAMDEDSERGALMKKNLAKWKETLLAPAFMTNYIDNFVAQLQEI